MAWDITKRDDGRWDWSCMQSAYGAAVGTSDTLAQAKVELAVAQAAVMEMPFPPSVVEAMRDDPDRYAADYPDPEARDEHK